MVEFEGNDKVVLPQPIIKDIDRTFQFTQLRNSLSRLIQSEADGDELSIEEIKEQELNTHYNDFVFRYGNLNHPSSKKLLCLMGRV